MYRKFRKTFRKTFKRYVKRPVRSFKRKYRKYKSAPFRPLVVRRFFKGNLVLSSTERGGAFQFALNDIPGASEFPPLFDMYKLVKVTMKLSPNCQAAEVGTPATGANITKAGGTFYWYKDYDDAGAPASITEVEQLPGRRQFLVTDGKVHSMSLYPAFSKAVFASATSTGYGPGRGWLDLTYPGVPHYGIKWYWAPFIPDAISNYPVCILNFETTYTFAFKGPR